MPGWPSSHRRGREDEISLGGGLARPAMFVSDSTENFVTHSRLIARALKIPHTRASFRPWPVGAWHFVPSVFFTGLDKKGGKAAHCR